MSAVLVHFRIKRNVARTMSDYMEIINPQTMIAKLLYNGEVVEEYKVEQCDKCSKLTKLDSFGYQKGYGNEKIIWFCGGCR
jgi:hypothetical protein